MKWKFTLACLSSVNKMIRQQNSMQAPLLGTVGENRNSIFIYCQTFGELPPMILMLSECTSSTSLSTLSRFWLLLQPCISPAQAEAPTTPSKSYFALTEKILFLLWVHVLDGSFQLSRTWSPEVFKKQTNKPNDQILAEVKVHGKL